MYKILLSLILLCLVGCDAYVEQPAYPAATESYGCVMVADDDGEHQVCNTRYYYTDNGVMYWDVGTGAWLRGRGYWNGSHYYAGPGFYHGWRGNYYHSRGGYSHGGGGRGMGGHGGGRR